jgi:hypothetical protein
MPLEHLPGPSLPALRAVTISAALRSWRARAGLCVGGRSAPPCVISPGPEQGSNTRLRRDSSVESNDAGSCPYLSIVRLGWRQRGLPGAVSHRSSGRAARVTAVSLRPCAGPGRRRRLPAGRG